MTNIGLGGSGAPVAVEKQSPISNAKNSLSGAIRETAEIASELAKRLDAITHPRDVVAPSLLKQEEVQLGSRATQWLKEQCDLVKSTNDQLRLLIETIEL